MRNPEAFLTPSTLLLGIGLSEQIASFSLLLMKGSSASKTLIWRTAAVSWCFISVFLIFQVIVIDYLASPYIVPNWWIGFIQMMNYLMDILATIAVSVILLLRMRVFYGKRSKMYIIMVLFGFLLLLTKGIGIFYAILVSYDVMTLKIIDYNKNPNFSYVFYYLAIGHSFESVFATIGSVGFLYAIGKGLGQSTKSLYLDILTKYDGIRLILIILLNGFISIFAIVAAIDSHIDYVTRIGLYLPAMTYALSFNTFLRISYISAKEILESQFSETLQNYGKSSNSSRMGSKIQSTM
ncbi:hypothetical protein BC833DRAFT_601473 [Globomyces pollinis-pini]|nr:hypothetical protein BC833DRAFT_601473 [Globomyces pollinis-pini]